MRFEVAVWPDVLADLDAMAAVHAERTEQWWQDGREAALALEPAARRAALAALREERDRRRAAGEHFDTRSSIVAYHLRAELDRRGWRGRTWPPVPRGEVTMPGRRWGVANDGTLSATFAVYVPDDDGELLRRATWKVSAPAVRRLQQIAAMGPRLPRPVRQERDRLRGQVVTTADVIRAAAAAAADSWRSPA